VIFTDSKTRLADRTRKIARPIFWREGKQMSSLEQSTATSRECKRNSIGPHHGSNPGSMYNEFEPHFSTPTSLRKVKNRRAGPVDKPIHCNNVSSSVDSVNSRSKSTTCDSRPSTPGG